MSVNVAELLASSKTKTKPGKAPDPVKDPEGTLRHHRSLWPLNQKVADDDLPAKPEGSDRVRLRRAAEELEGCGVIMGGNFARDYRADANATMSGGFSGSGDLWGSNFRVSINDPGTMEHSEMTALIQNILQHWGFAVVATLDGELAIANPGSERSTQWAETGIRLGYGGTSAMKKTSPAKMLQYSRALGAHSHSASDWAASSFSPEQAASWASHGVRSSREAQGWIDLGLNEKQAQEWAGARASFVDAGEWIKAGFTPAKTKPWTAITSSTSQAHAWIAGGFTPEQAKMWIDFCGYGLRSPVPANVQILIDGKVGPRQLVRLQEAGCDGKILDPLVRWVGRYKIDLEEALLWAELGPEFIGPGKRGRWHKAGFTPKQVRVWQKAMGRRGITLDEVKSRMDAGFDPEQGAEWSVLSDRFSNSALVASWTGAGFGPKDAKPWVLISQTFCDYETVQKWQAAGYDIADVRSWVAANPNFSRYETVQKWQEADARLKDNPALASELSRVTHPDALRQILTLLKGAS